MRRVTITLTDGEADVLDAIAHVDALTPRRRSTVVRQIVAHTCVTAMRERPEVAEAVDLRRRYQARPLASVTVLRGRA